MVDAVATAPTSRPVSLVLEGEYGVEGGALGAGVAPGRGGLIHEWQLAEEQDAFERAAELVREATERVAAELEARVAGAP